VNLERADKFKFRATFQPSDKHGVIQDHAVLATKHSHGVPLTSLNSPCAAAMPIVPL